MIELLWVWNCDVAKGAPGEIVSTSKRKESCEVKKKKKKKTRRGCEGNRDGHTRLLSNLSAALDEVELARASCRNTS
jgi:hypothetical protein